MSEDRNRAVMDAATTLAAALAKENRALAALDLPAALSLLEGKHRAADAFAASVAGAGPGAMAHALAAELRGLAEENRALLERAITVQGRVLASIARAVPRAMAQGGAYGARGAATSPRSAPAVSLSARA